jgi:hypothetical protein
MRPLALSLALVALTAAPSASHAGFILGGNRLSKDYRTELNRQSSKCLVSLELRHPAYPDPGVLSGSPNSDASSFVNPPPDQTRHAPPGSPSSKMLAGEVRGGTIVRIVRSETVRRSVRAGGDGFIILARTNRATTIVSSA